jgi:hypothetical protein
MTTNTTGVITTYHDNEKTQINEIYFQIDGKMEGEYKAYHKNGKLFKIYNCINGLREGPFTSYYNNGQIAFTYNCIKGKIYGELKEFDSDGRLLLTQKLLILMIYSLVMDYLRFFYIKKNYLMKLENLQLKKEESVRYHHLIFHY